MKEMTVTNNMIRRMGFAFALCSTVILAGCTAEELALEEKYEPYGGTDRYPITVANGPVTLNVSTRGNSLQPAQVNAVASFARQASAAGLTPVTISRPSGGGASAAVANDVATVLAEQGVPRQMIRTKTYRGSHHGTVRVSFVRSYAKTRPCGRWSENMAETDLNKLNPNHGCATQANVAAMLANPMDAEVPRSMDPANATAAVTAIDALTGGGAASSSAAAAPAAAAAATP